MRDGRIAGEFVPGVASEQRACGGASMRSLAGAVFGRTETALAACDPARGGGLLARVALLPDPVQRQSTSSKPIR